MTKTVELSTENRERMRHLDAAVGSMIREMGDIVAEALQMDITNTTRFMYPEITGRRIRAEAEWAVVCNGTVCGFWDPSTGTCHE